MHKKFLNAFALALFACLVLGFGFAIWHATQQQQQTINRGHPKPSEVSRTESPDDRIATYTLWLAILTGVLALSTIGLWIETRRAGGRQSRDMKASIDLARAEFVSTQRPKLRVRNIVVFHPPNRPPGTGPALFTEGHPLQCQFYVANVGGTPATIVAALAMILQSRYGLPMRRPYEGREGNLIVPRKVLTPGESTPLAFIGDEDLQDGAQTIGTAVIHGVRLFVLGWIEYRDEIDVIRRTSFCREFKRGPWDEGRFRRVKNRDYEHEE